MWARIENGAVAEITNIDPAGRFHPSLLWYRFDGRTNVAPGWTFDGEAFTQPVVSIADLATAKRAEIESALQTALAAGMPYTMPDGTADVIQTRPEDESNLLGLAIEARDLRTAGETGAVMSLRAQSNHVYTLTPEQMIALTDAAKAFKQQLLANSWVLKDSIDDAKASNNREDIPEIAWQLPYRHKQ